jgi:hypothetical protein
VRWRPPEHRVDDECADLEVQLGLGDLDLGRERALESLDDNGFPVCGLRMSRRISSCGIPRLAKSLTMSR